MDLDRLARRLAAAGAPAADPGARSAAVALLLRLELGETEVLLMRRSERADDRWSGQIGLPGGHAEPADPDLYATALRETREEVGVDLSRARLLGSLAPVQAKARGELLSLWITPFVFAAAEPLEPAPGPEALEVFWFPLERARAGELAAEYRYRRGTAERVLPAWRLGERVVWGLTFEILSGFLRAAE